MNQRIIDISLSLGPDLPIWEGDPPIYMERVSKIEDGAQSNVTRLDMGVHTGTHIDAPYHFLLQGNTVDKISMDVFIGPVQVVQMPASCDVIDLKNLKDVNLEKGIERILFKTRNSNLWLKSEKKFHTDFVAVSADGAQYLRDSGIRLVGIDYLSIAPFDSIEEPHQILLSAGIVALEGLDLSKVDAGLYTLICLPLKLVGCDGAPARAVLLEG